MSKDYSDWGYNNLFTRDNGHLEEKPAEKTNPFSLAQMYGLIPDGSINPSKLYSTLTGGQTLQSNNYSAGSTGWILNGDGTSEFN